MIQERHEKRSSVESGGPLYRRTSVEDGIEQGERSPHEGSGEDVGARLEEARAAVLVEDLPALHSGAQARRRGQKGRGKFAGTCRMPAHEWVKVKWKEEVDSSRYVTCRCWK